MSCVHVFFDTARDENNDRIRVVQRCGRCEDERYGCFAKRLDDEGRTAWGPVGEWHYTPRQSLKQIRVPRPAQKYNPAFVYRTDTDRYFRCTDAGLIPVDKDTVARESDSEHKTIETRRLK